MPLTGLTSRAPYIRELVWSKLTGTRPICERSLMSDESARMWHSSCAFITFIPIREYLSATYTIAAVGQREVVCDAAEQLQDRGKLLGMTVAVKDDSATIAKKVFNSIANTAVAKSSFMHTPPLGHLIKRAHAAATQEHLTEIVSTSSAAQLRSRSGGQGVVKRRGSVRVFVLFDLIT
jgi:hypothetical protein